MDRAGGRRRRAGLLAACALGACLAGCRSPTAFREDADQSAYAIVDHAQQKAFGRQDGLRLDRPADSLRRRLLLDHGLPQSNPASLGAEAVPRIPQWPDKTYGAGEPSAETPPSPSPLRLTLLDALGIAARSSRDYQDQKETVFLAALKLDLERDAFRNTWTGQLESLFSQDGGGEADVRGVENRGQLGVTRRLQSGGSFALNLGLDLVKLLTGDAQSAFGSLADATISMPLLRGAGRFVVTEPLTQAERDVVYAIYTFERFKRTFAVRVAADYFGVLQQLDQVKNARDNYQRLVLSTRRAQRLADAGRLPAIQVDQARQDELRARNRWISALLAYERQLDALKALLGLPPDAAMELDRDELDRQAARAAALARAAPVPAAAKAPGAPTPQATDPVTLPEPTREGGGPMELAPDRAVRLALEHRLDLRAQIGKIDDAQRGVAVAADQLRADLSLLGRGSVGESRNLGSASQGDARLNAGRGRYSAALTADLPLERTAERNAYRAQLIAFERSVRAVQELEDQVKLDVRNELRTLVESRETVMIQAAAADVAQRRLDSTTMFLEAGRAEIRDVLEAEEALVSAQNALTAALVRYRIGELQLQRDMGLLEIDPGGLWKEYVPLAEDQAAANPNPNEPNRIPAPQPE